MSRRNKWIFFGLLISLTGVTNHLNAQKLNDDLRIIFIRHGEKPKTGDNLNCQGLNRAMALPAVITGKFGIPAYCYVPSLGLDSSTKHARMFQTVTPLAVKYGLKINSSFGTKDSAGIAKDILLKHGTVLLVWNHNYIASIVHAIGISNELLKWDDNDFDSIWEISFSNGVPVFTKDKENLLPAADCQ